MLDNIKNRVGSIFSQKIDLNKEIRLLEDELQTIAEIRGMAETVGYKKYKQWMLDKITYNREQIVRMSVDVDKNKMEITKLYWFCDFLESQIRAIDLCLVLEPDKTRKLEQFNGLVNEAGLDLEIIGG